ncbi:siderophore-interacting protein [Amycolatopsis acidicola]|uniref:Siderophore-interacting protein n=1 Tax=Amycolatopsis acidicola TaxID=2596893 RepID=A0A5N0V8C5_9PSEU|nr:siderophore-interacting protein [Amycolatopsis acidicola]
MDARGRDLTVSRVHQLSRSFVRVTLTGEELDGFSSPSPDDHVKVFFPDTEGRPSRDYTPRAWRPDARELDLDFVVHGDQGPATAWAARARPGDRLYVGGPRGTAALPADAGRVLLLADETALPAACRWIEEAPDPARITLLAWLADEEDRAYLDQVGAAHVTIRWISDPVAAMRDEGDLTASYVWARGEATELVPVRRYLRRELGLAPEQADVRGYWRRGTADADQRTALDPGEE